MRQVVQVFLQMLFRRLGPEDLPDSGFLLAVTAVMYVLTQFLLAYVVYGAVPQLFSLVALEIALLVAGTWALLLSAGRADRLLPWDHDRPGREPVPSGLLHGPRAEIRADRRRGPEQARRSDPA